MSCVRAPKRASIAAPASARRCTSASVSTWRCATATSCTPPPGARRSSVSSAERLSTCTARLRREYSTCSATRRPSTTRIPMPRLAAMKTLCGVPPSGSRVTITPEASESTAFCTSTAMATASCAMPAARRASQASKLKTEAHTLRTASCSAASPFTLGTVVYRPAPLKPGRSSELDELRTNTPAACNWLAQRACRCWVRLASNGICSISARSAARAVRRTAASLSKPGCCCMRAIFSARPKRCMALV
ncbi:hypothetical protein D3C72_1522380 [compost metagenome]